MQNGIGPIIEGIRLYNCGYCVNDLKRMYQEIKKPQKVVFHARVMLIEHKKYGSILVDTGYSKRVYENGLVSKLYHLLNPTFYKKGDHILHQLKKDGIRQRDIAMIILTHLHPDHIGGLRDFKHMPIIMSSQCRERMKKAAFKDLVFKNQLGIGIEQQLRAFPMDQQSPLKNLKGKDLFGDGSVWLIELPGHACGHTGVYLPEKKLLYVADALWGRSYMDYTLRFLPRLIQNDYPAYVRTVKKLSALKGITIITAHGGERYHETKQSKDHPELSEIQKSW